MLLVLYLKPFIKWWKQIFKVIVTLSKLVNTILLVAFATDALSAAEQVSEWVGEESRV